MNKSIVNTVQRQCRTCLSESNNTRLLQDYISVLDSNMKIAQLIMKCASVEINTEDVLPNIICNLCVDYASASFIFRRRCEESEKKLKSQLIKTEESDSDKSTSITRIYDSISRQGALTSSIDTNLHVLRNILHTENSAKVHNNDPITEDLTLDIDYNYTSEEENDDDIPLIAIKKELDATIACRQDISAQASLSCSDCPKSFTTIDDFRTHERQHLFNKIHPDCDIECVECEQQFGDRKILFQHFLTHTSYKCRMCKKRIKTMYELSQHSCEKDLSKRTCGICSKVFGTVAHRKRHMPTHDASVSACRFCDFKSERPFELTLHMKSSHDELRVVQCPDCDKRFFTKIIMQQHRTIHNGQRKSVCDYCGKEFDQRYLKEHTRIHTGERAHTCNVCQKQFIQYASLVSHRAVHLPRQQHVCPICGKTSPRKGGLRIHMKRHLDERPFQCSVCSKAFKTKPEFEKHEKIHTGETPHVCAVCGKGFIQAQSLKAHMKTHNRKTGIL